MEREKEDNAVFGKNQILKREKEFNGTTWIQEVFYTIQGEGPLGGSPAIFVRFAGCCLACKFCDTDFESSTWRPTVEELLEKIEEVNPGHCKLVVITGGEPFLQMGIVPLTEQLLERGYRVQVETSGSQWQKGFPVNRSDVTIVCSPKTGKLNKTLEKHIDAYKYVIRVDEVSEVDGLPDVSPETEKRLTRGLARPSKNVPVYVMPCDEHMDIKTNYNVRETVRISLKYGYHLCLQVHKIIGVD